MMSNPVTVHIGMTAFELNLDGLPAEEAQFAEYAATLDDARLEALKNGLRQAFDSLVGTSDEAPKLSETDTAKAIRYATQVRLVKAEAATRERAKTAAEATEAAARQQQALAKLRDDVHDKPRPKAKAQPDAEDDDGDEGDETDDAVTAAATRFAGAIEAMVQKMTPAADVIVRGGDINRHLRGVNLAEVGRRAPDPGLPRLEPVLVAASGLRGTAPGGRISGMNELVTLGS